MLNLVKVHVTWYSLASVRYAAVVAWKLIIIMASLSSRTAVYNPKTAFYHAYCLDSNFMIGIILKEIRCKLCFKPVE